MYAKIGLSLAALPNAHIHVIGYPAPRPDAPATLFFHPLPAFKRLSWGRLKAQWNYAKKLLQVRPDLIIINTPEYQLVTIAYKIIFGAKMYYDVLENYQMNITQTNVWPRGIRTILGQSVRLLEWGTRLFTDQYLLAERHYQNELPFVQNKFTILENKYKPEQTFLENPPSCLNNPRNRFLLSGTLAEHYGLFDAITFAERAYALDPDTRLTIIGYCAQESVWQRLQAAVAQKPYIRLIGGDRPVPHDQIVAEIRHAGVGLLPYHRSPAVDYSFPTKLFEYMAHRLPVLMTPNPYWETIAQPYQSAIFSNISKDEISNIISNIKVFSFYKSTEEHDLAKLLWQNSEHHTLVALVKRTLGIF
ncbi:Glycosyltransferase involved in cell wall bisynthesis [Catalinimonas alkaloidigena]|uniref:Glycosyltransferase involved in cell wall bisynthesis n=2 Tax=Catalinimonas alkaloidigena TaxID=1075417 RepID=A0A1G9T388_9BACT|nr:Glycosyltransferase involved in cell wall bisynthesis [Catalinimonas alkaloidigena]